MRSLERGVSGKPPPGPRAAKAGMVCSLLVLGRMASRRTAQRHKGGCPGTATSSRVAWTRRPPMHARQLRKLRTAIESVRARLGGRMWLPCGSSRTSARSSPDPSKTKSPEGTLPKCGPRRPGSSGRSRNSRSPHAAFWARLDELLDLANQSRGDPAARASGTARLRRAPQGPARARAGGTRMAQDAFQRELGAS
jgi:hypothetical protein